VGPGDVYGIWGVPSDVGDTEQSARAQLDNWTGHSMNAIMGCMWARTTLVLRRRWMEVLGVAGVGQDDYMT